MIMSRRHPFIQINFGIGRRVLTYWLRSMCRIVPEEAEYLSELLDEFYRQAPKKEADVLKILETALDAAGWSCTFAEFHDRPAYIISKYKPTKLREMRFQLFTEGEWQDETGDLYTVKCTKNYVEPFSQFLKTADKRLYVYDKHLVSLPTGRTFDDRILFTGDIVLCNGTYQMVVYNEQTDDFEAEGMDFRLPLVAHEITAIVGNYFEIGYGLRLFDGGTDFVKAWSALSEAEKLCIQHFYRTALQRLDYEYCLDYPALTLFRAQDEMDFIRRYDASRRQVAALRKISYRRYHYTLRLKPGRHMMKIAKEHLLLSPQNNPHEIID